MTAVPVISCVVEGHGEVRALPVLLRRVVPTFAQVQYAEVVSPHRQTRSALLRDGGIERAVALAALKVGDRPGGVLVVLDADDDCPAELGPRLLDRVRAAARGVPAQVVLANREYESWFLAAASSLAGERELPPDLSDHPAPDEVRDAKGWVRSRMPPGRSYSETVDQAPLSASLDLDLAYSRSDSFGKLVRSVQSLLELEEESGQGDSDGGSR